VSNEKVLPNIMEKKYLKIKVMTNSHMSNEILYVDGELAKVEKLYSNGIREISMPDDDELHTFTIGKCSKTISSIYNNQLILLCD
jgi:hypothetical protein